MNGSKHLSGDIEQDMCAAANNFTLVKSFGLAYDRYAAVILLCLSTYLFAVLTFYEWKRFRKTNTAVVNRLVLLSTFAGFLYGLRVGLDRGATLLVSCTVYNYLGGGAYAICQSLVYTVLWARQRKFYADPILSQSVPRLVKILSAVVIFLIYLIGITLPFAIISSFCTTQSSVGCVILWNRTSVYASALPTVLTSFVIMLIGQIALFLLITHPLVAANSDGRASLCRVLWRKTRLDIFSMVKRLAVCSGVCILSSLAMHSIVLLDALGYLHTFWQNFMCLDLIISNVSLSCTFADWRDRMFPFADLLKSCVRKICAARAVPTRSKTPARSSRVGHCYDTEHSEMGWTQATEC